MLQIVDVEDKAANGLTNIVLDIVTKHKINLQRYLHSECLELQTIMLVWDKKGLFALALIRVNTIEE